MADGFVARFLFVWPENQVMPNWSEVEPDQSVFETYHKIMDCLYKMPSRITYRTSSEDKPKFEPIVLQFDEEGKKEWIKFYNEVRVTEYNNTQNTNLKSMLSKFDRHCAKFALIIELMHFACDNFENGMWENLDFLDKMNIIRKVKVTKRSMKAAVKLVEYFKATSFKLYSKLRNPVLSLKEYEQVWYNNLEDLFKAKEAIELGAVMKAKDQKFSLGKTRVYELLKKNSLFKAIGSGRYEKLW